MRILFFIESLSTGGKERRLMELILYLKKHTNVDVCLVLSEPEIGYPYVSEIDMQIHVIQRRLIKYDPLLFFKFYKIVKSFKPDIIHTWGRMTTFYALPTKLLLRKVLLTNLIANAHRKYKKFSLSNLFFYCDVLFSNVILSNSQAGIKAYGLQNNKKTKLIYNGVRLERFNIHPDKEGIKKTLKIKTPYVIIMVASASKKKDYDLLLDVAKIIARRRDDVTFLGVGNGSEFERLNQRVEIEGISNVRLLGKREDVEQLCYLSDICLLFSPCEGISNAIIEYMALGKPVITTDTKGGSVEIIEEGKSGFIIPKNIENIANKIIELLDNPKLSKQLGERGRTIIQQKFSIERMANEYISVYERFKRIK